MDFCFLLLGKGWKTEILFAFCFLPMARLEAENRVFGNVVFLF